MTSVEIESPKNDREALEVLTDIAHGKSGTIPPERLAAHAIAVTQGCAWPVRRAALEALLRRRQVAVRDGLVVDVRPPRGVGRYVIANDDKQARPYAPAIWSLDPLEAACDCSDFLRSSLGLCKHLYVALEDALERHRRAPRPLVGPRLRWDPVRPLEGPGDPLARVRASPCEPALPRSFFDERGHLVMPVQQEEARREVVTRLQAAVEHDEERDPALEGILARDVLRLERLRSGVDAASRDEALASLKRPLFPYQLEGVGRFLAVSHFLLADDMGLGKTAQAIASCHVLHRLGRVTRGIIVTPASLKSQWAREWHAFTDAPVTVVEGNRIERAALYAARPEGFFIVGYEQLVRDLHEVRRFAPDLVVLDEAQRIKNWATKTAQSVKALHPRYRLVLTGTPFENRLEELASLLDWIDDTALAPIWRLEPHHLVRADGQREVRGVQALETLRARLAPVLLRRARQDVLKQLPPRRDTRIDVAVTDAQMAEHSEHELPIASLLARARRRALRHEEFLKLMTHLTAQRIVCNGLALTHFEQMWPALRAQKPTPALVESLGAPKLVELRALIEALVVDQGRKVVVFSQWRRMLELSAWAVSDLLAQHGLRAMFFTGAERERRRTQNVVDFHDDRDARVLFCSDAGGVGLNLQRAATACICLELPWNPAVLEQRIGRIYRLGQVSPVDVITLVAARGIEARIASIVAGKHALFRGLFDGTSNDVQFESGGGGFIARISALVEPPPPAEVVGDDAGRARSDEDEQLDGELPGVREDLVPVDEVTAASSGEPSTSPGSDAAPPRVPTSSAASAGGAPDLDLRGLQALLRDVEVTPRSDGGLHLSAPPAAAAALAALFAGVGQLFAAAAQRPAP